MNDDRKTAGARQFGRRFATTWRAIAREMAEPRSPGIDPRRAQRDMDKEAGR